MDGAAERWWRNYLDHHVAYNASVEVTYTDRSRAKLVGYGDAGDSALWTGTFLAAAVHRYNLTKEPEVLQRIQATVGVYENLTRVSGKLGFMGDSWGSLQTLCTSATTTALAARTAATLSARRTSVGRSLAPHPLTSTRTRTMSAAMPTLAQHLGLARLLPWSATSQPESVR